jgi:hypothetical protein
MNKSGFVHTLPSGRLSCDWPLLLLPVSKFRGFAGGSRHPRGQSRFREEGGGEEPAAACEGKSSWSFCVERVCCELEGERLATRDVHAPLWWRMNEDQLTWIAGNTEYDVPCYFILVLFRELSPFLVWNLQWGIQSNYEKRLKKSWLQMITSSGTSFRQVQCSVYGNSFHSCSQWKAPPWLHMAPCGISDDFKCWLQQ